MPHFIKLLRKPGFKVVFDSRELHIDILPVVDQVPSRIVPQSFVIGGMTNIVGDNSRHVISLEEWKTREGAMYAWENGFSAPKSSERLDTINGFLVEVLIDKKEARKA